VKGGWFRRRSENVNLLGFQIEILRRMIGAFLRGKKGSRSWGGSG